MWQNKNRPLRGKELKFDQMYEVRISQDTAVTFLGVVDRFNTTYVKLFQGCTYQNLCKLFRI